ncbi:acyl-CoA dehydrogenase family protein [Streptomyces sp. NPDC005799]|uniref:acyl-CoA dehydrogenase family protein n=1 Tax=Streptomyces sp. NPDC005799 TaxID=3154678 RepID=UPI0033D22369
MDLHYSDTERAYRIQVRELLRQLLGPDWRGLGALSEGERQGFRVSWREALQEQGLLAPGWPSEYGGGGLGLIEQSIVAEELAEAGAPQFPTANDANGIVLLGPTLMHYGSAEQKAYFLPRTLSGEIRWAQGYSEPEAGSDLFNVRTRAVRQGDSWVINGQKIWQTAGVTANWLFGLFRTDPASPGGRGLSFMLLPMDQPGVTVRGIRNMAGETEFAEVFFTDATAAHAHVVGGVGNGAQVALGLLGFERGAGGVAAAAAARIEVERLTELARATGAAGDSAVRASIARCRADVHVLRCLALRSLAAGVSGAPPGPESSITKMFTSQYRQRITELALDILGPRALSLDGPGAVAPLGPQPLGLDPTSATVWIQDALHARPGTVYGGSLQIQRNTIAERVLGLPREPRPAAARNAQAGGDSSAV